MKRTLKRELKALEIVEREPNGIGYGRVAISHLVSSGVRETEANAPVSGSECSLGVLGSSIESESVRFTVGRRSEGR